MYLPLRQNLTSDIDDMISEKNDLLAGSSGCSNTENSRKTRGL
jgi:ATP-dependent protease HslVU (ClpYQ) ATPase subunit